MVQNTHLLAVENEAIKEQAESMSKLSEKLGQLAGIADARTAARAATLRSRLEEFAAKVTLVGQVKAGKSALTNILAGHPGLLPSDVNPWTSVVTTIAINTKAPSTGDDDTTRARFTFFDQDEWDNLVVGGGRLGELADRAGAQDEMEDIQRQIEEMRKNTQQRLGKHFELLLGQNHSYGYVDTELMERYVCMGDGVATNDISTKTGRFADITKSADLYLDIPEYGTAIQLCDTPGVNDTFMMREQITIRSLRGSEICVVVLSAHQALTTVDMALMRIIATLDKRQVILFVNRVDELQDPENQIPEIREGILHTLKSHNIDDSAEVIFGSAKWAEAALLGDLSTLSDASAESLAKYIESHPEFAGKHAVDGVWAASGLPELLNAMWDRVSEGSGKRLLDRVRRNARNLTNEARATMIASRNKVAAGVNVDLGGKTPLEAMEKLAKENQVKIDELTRNLRSDLMKRMEAAQTNFVKRATDSLIDHLERYGEQGKWQYDPAGLRVLQRAAYFSFSRAVRSKVGKLYAEASVNVEAVYRASVGDHLGDFQIEPPQTPIVPPPVGLGKTIALDLQSTWWRRWWQKRRGYQAYANDYAHLIRTEAESITKDLEETQVSAVLENIRATLDTFMSEHLETITKICAEQEAGDGQISDANQISSNLFGEILKELGEEAA
ncbi:dynamin family protein [Actibacterium pelagium]|uniref:Dynamin family protein n=1 Tax=Actibacterium pelagium TaxID=2029103 RepID=A0A917A9U3_9RHOB|nr:dynamin family protein [Actibacterium pelagium]GGE37360.1 dynamin family protein [Actibacterium pelagium]